MVSKVINEGREGEMSECKGEEHSRGREIKRRKEESMKKEEDERQ